MVPLPRFVRPACALFAFAFSSITAFAQNIAVTTLHAPTINGGARIEGSVQQLRGENALLNGNATLTEDLLVPGTPNIQVNGNASWQGPQAGSGATTPAGYTVVLGGDVTLRHVRTRTDPIAIPTVPAPPATSGTRNVELKKATDSAGNWATVRDLKLSGQAGTVAVPPGTYRDFTASGQTGLILGSAGATQPSSYNFQSLTLNGQARLEVVGPIVLTLNSGLGLHGQIGNVAHPEWLQVRIASGGVEINGGATLHAGLVARSGTLMINGQGTFCGTAAVDRFTINGGGLVRWCNTNLGGGNRPPVADPQIFTTAEETPLPVTLTGSDPDGNSLAFTVTTPPQHGTLSGAAPNLIYTPAANFPATNSAPGTDTFTFTVRDGTAASAPATVTITIAPVNDPPIAHAQQVVVTEDTPLILTLTGSDVDGDALVFSIPTGQQMLGALERYTGPGAAPGDFLYTPASNSNAPDSFIFLVEDGHGGSAQGSVAITITPVDDVPVVAPLQLTVPEHGTLPITLTGVDPDWELLTLEPVAGSGPTHGTLTGSSPDYVYTPNATFPPTNTASGFDSFQYRAFDPSGDASAPALVTIQVTPVDDPPVAHSGEIDTAEDTAIAFVISANDEENEPLTYEVQQPPQHGSLTGAGPTFVYSPDGNYFGDDSFTFIAIDGADPSALPSALATVTIHVSSRNDPPVAQALGVITTEDTPVLITLGASDVDNDQLTFLVPRPAENGESFGPQHGTLAPTEDPKVWLYAPALNSTEPDQFTFQVRDPVGAISAAVVSIVVTPINDYPVATPLTLAVDEDQPLALTLSGVDMDDLELTYKVIEGIGLTLGTLSGTAPSLIYQSRPDLSGPDFFDFIAIDSLLFESAPARVSITVRPVNDPPVAQELEVETEEDAPIEITFAATDVEDDAVTFLAPTAPSYGLIEPLAPGHYRYTPDANFHGTDTFTYAASDGQADSQPAAVTIRVLPQNDTPVASPPPALITREDTPLTLGLAGADIDGDTLTILDPSAPLHGTLVRDPEQPSRFIYTPAANYHGSDTFTYAVYDGTMASPATTVTIEVESVNDAPIVDAGPDANTTLGIAAALAGTVDDVDDAIGHGLTMAWTKVSGPGAVAFSTPEAATSFAQFTATGTYLLRLTASDSEFSVADDVTVVVAAGNQAPVVEAGANQVLPAPGEAFLDGTATDDGLPAGSTLHVTWRLVSGPAAVSFTMPQSRSTGVVFNTPGTYVLRLTASDGALASSSELTIKVNQPNAAPNVDAGPDATTAYGAVVALSGKVTDDGLPAAAGVAVAWSKVSGPGAVQFADATAAVTSATFSAAGTYILRLSATDSELIANDAVSVVVQPAPNQAPTVNAGPDQTLQVFRTVQLSGSALDDGQPQGNTLTFAWSKVSGPGTAAFATASSAVTTVSFSVPGAYVLRLAASDGELSASDDVNITLSMNNQAPFVDAGFDQTVIEGESAILSGEAADDGLPAGQPITFTWSKASGPGTVTFANSAAARTSATFSGVGNYVFKLTASDSALSASDFVTVTVRDACNPVAAPDGLVGFWKGEGNAEDARGEFHGTAVNGVAYAAGEVDLAFSFDGVNDYVTVPNPGSQSKLDVGAGDGFTIETWIKPSDLRVTALFEWNNGTPGAHFWIGFGGVTCAYVDLVDINGGSHPVITPAGLYVVGQWQHLVFTYDKPTSSCRIYRNGALFHQFAFGTSFTPQTTYDFQVGRRPGHPTTFGGALDEVSLYNRALTQSEIQTIYNSGACGKTDGYPAEYPSVAVNAGADQSIFLPQSATLPGRVIDRRLDRSIPLSLLWSEISGPSAVRFEPETTGATATYFEAPGDYVLRLTATDGTVTSADDVTVHVNEGVFTHKIRLQSGNGTSQDPLNRFTLDGGTTWQPASLTSNSVYSVIPGTSYIVGQFVSLSSSRTRARFFLPAAFGNPQLSIQFYADNAIRVHLNGTQIGQSPPGFTNTTQLINYAGTFAFDAPATTALVTTASLFHPGENILEIENFNSFGPMGADYLATVSFDAAGDSANQPPVVTAGADRTLVAPASTTLVGTVSDEAQPLPDLLLTNWEKLSGPGTVVFSAPNSATTNATFSATGDYILRLTANDGEYSVNDTLKVTVLPAPNGQNQAPVVSAGPDLGVGMLTTVLLQGLAVDDGRPLATPQVQWQKVSGPGPVGFSDPHSAETNATFGAAGEYVLSLMANDGLLSATDSVSVTVSDSTFVNHPPVADAGPDRMVQLPNAEVTLTGTAADDGLPTQAPLSVHWEILSAPGAAELRDAGQTTATVRFAAPGDYVFRITASDGLLSSSDECVIYVLPVPSSDPLNTAPVVFAGNDQVVAGLGPAALAGTLSDDGHPGSLLTAAWTKVSGPGAVQFGDDSAAQTTALFNAPGTYVLRLTASDGSLSSSDDVQIVAGAGGNQPPGVSVGPDRTGAAGVPLTLTATVNDDGLPNGILELTWSVVSGPGGVTLGSAAGASVQAQFAMVGAYTLRARVSDGQFEAFDEVVVTVSGGTNAPPVVQLTAPANGASLPSGQPVTIAALASDPEGALQHVEFHVDGERIATASAAPFQCAWTPGDLGNHTLTAAAIDGIGQRTESAVVVKVTVGPPVVRMTSPLDGAGIAPGAAIPLGASASSRAGITRIDFVADGALVASANAAPYTASWSTLTEGPHEITATAVAGDGQTAVSAPIAVYLLPRPAGAPTVEISAPTDDASVTAPTTVVGTVDSPALRDWTLEYQRLGVECGTWIALAQGTGAVHNDALGVFDPTLLINGHYELRLTARDRFGGVSVSSTHVAVEGGMKVGHFTVAFEDLRVPLAGLPLSVVRTYDSREQCPGDFGHGWRLDVESLRLEQSAAAGDGWSIRATVGTLTTPSTYQLVDEGGHLLSVRLPDGELLRFRPKLVVDRPYNRLASLLDGDNDDVGQAWLPFQYTQPLRLIYHPLGGTRAATLRSRGYRAFDPWSGGASTIAGDGALYVGDPSDGPMSLATSENSAQDAPLLADATGWELTLKDGRVFTFDGQGRLEEMRDAVGNTLSFVRDGAGRISRVSHSSGPQVVFHRDTDGFVERITDPSGRELHYGYDAAGHLRTFHDREADPATEPPTQSFTYRAGSHLLDDLFDGRGVRAARNYYDAEGRLERSVDADGNETRLTHDLAGRVETVRDRAGNVTRHHYDERGNVTRTEQPDGTIVTMAYHVWSDGRTSDLKVSQSVSGLFSDGAGGLAPKTLTTLYSYEDDDPATPPANDGLLHKLVDPLGHTSHFSYDSQGHVLTVTDPLGHTTTNTYHPGTNLLATTTDAAENVMSFTYDARGLLDKETRTVTVVDETGASRIDTLVTDYDYDANGYLVRTVDPAGHATTFENDAHGNRLFERTTRTVNGASSAVVTEHEYDANDRLVHTWDAEHPRAGGYVPTSETVYDETGRVAITRDALGRETAMTYDARGLLARTDFADGTSETVLYDAEGRREFATDRRGKTTQTIYDTLGRVSSMVFLGSGSNAPVTLSATTYDAGGRAYQSTDANGHTTTNIYDDVGRRVGVIDPLGHTSTWQYDAASNQRFFTDALGRTTEHLYDVLNRRVHTVHPPSTLDINGDGAISANEQSVVTTTSTAYDELGRRVSETDASGRTTRFIFDALGRLSAVAQPSTPPTVTRYTYDELGNQLTQTDANNHTTSYGYDSLGRRTTRTLPGGQSESLNYNAVGNVAHRTDFNGTVTGYIYDALNRLLSRTSNHPSAAASNVSFTYTPSGQRATMADVSGVTTYSYDARDRLESKATPQGTLSYAYDAAGNVTSISSSNANGTAVAYRYDELNRLAEVEEGAGEITHYGYNEVGNLAHVSTANGVTHAYGYNALNRLTQLSIQNATASLAHFAYTQLPTGHRSSVVEEFAGTPANPQSTTRNPQYRYNALYRLTSETITTNTGPGGALNYGLDSVGNRLTRTSTVAGLSSQTFSYNANDRLSSDGYDANGNTITGHIALNAQGAETTPQTVNDTYDAENRLVSRSGSLNILYDGDGNKVRETINGQTFTNLVDNLNPTGYAQVLEELHNGTVIRLYTYGHDLLVQDQRDAIGNWNASWYGYDGHGSVRLLTDGAGHVTDRYDYDAFGTLLHAEGATFNRYRYCGEQFDDALGLYYLRARYLNAANGRFWSMDSYGGSRGDPSSLHKYLYGGADPMNWTDPTGYWSLSELSVTQKIALTVGGIGAVRGGYGAYRHGEDVLTGAIWGFAAGYLATYAIITWPATAWIIIPGGLVMTVEEFYRNVTEGKWDLVGIDIALLVSGPRLARYTNEIRPVEPAPPSATKVGTNVTQDVMVIGRQPDTAALLGKEGNHVLNLHPADWNIPVNDAWMQAGIDTRTPFRLATPELNLTNLTRRVQLLDGTFRHEPSVYLRELKMLRDAGYTRSGNMMIPPSGP